MTENMDTRVQSIDGATLTPLVRQALGSETVEVTDFARRLMGQGIGYGNIGRTTLHRFSGEA